MLRVGEASNRSVQVPKSIHLQGVRLFADEGESEVQKEKQMDDGSKLKVGGIVNRSRDVNVNKK